MKEHQEISDLEMTHKITGLYVFQHVKDMKVKERLEKCPNWGKLEIWYLSAMLNSD